MLRRAAPALVLIAVALAGILGLASRPNATTPTEHADYVVVAGAAGLRWDDVNPTDTPTLWKLAQEGSVGALSVRSATSPTCPSDGWLTLGAGNLAERGQVPAAGQCPPMQVPLTHPDNIGASLKDQGKIVQLNKELPYGAQPGALAEAVRCTAAVGVGAAVAAARPYGRVDKYSDDLPTDFRSYLASCVLSMVDLGTLDAADPAARQAQARAVDARLATVLANRPDRSLVLVAGLADTQAGTRLHVAIADGPGYHGGWLTSSSTARSGYVQLADLAPTVLTALDKPLPTDLFAGATATSTGGPQRVRPTPTGRPAPSTRWPAASSGYSRAPRWCCSPPWYPCCAAPAGTPASTGCAPHRRGSSGRSNWPWSRPPWPSRPPWSPTPYRGGAPAPPGCCSPASRWRWSSR